MVPHCWNPAREPQTSDVVIDGDADLECDMPPPTNTTLAQKALPCRGFVFTNSLDYPFELHDTLTQWGFEYRCPHSTIRQLRQEIQGRSEQLWLLEGMHENTNYSYYGLSTLIEILRRKDKRIQGLRLHRHRKRRSGEGRSRCLDARGASGGSCVTTTTPREEFTSQRATPRTICGPSLSGNWRSRSVLPADRLCAHKKPYHRGSRRRPERACFAGITEVIAAKVVHQILMWARGPDSLGE